MNNATTSALACTTFAPIKKAFKQKEKYKSDQIIRLTDKISLYTEYDNTFDYKPDRNLNQSENNNFIIFYTISL